MLRLSKDEWERAEQLAAAHKRGERRERYHTWRRFYAVPTSIAVALGAIGLGCWWVVKHVARAVAGGVPTGSPGGYWFFFGAALVLTVAAMSLKPTTFSLAAGRAVALAAMWLGLIGYGLASLI